MSDPIRHHHVPQTYLRNFSFVKKSEFKLYTYDKISKKIFEANVDDVAVEKNFYTVNNIQDIYAWENFYAQSVEPMMGTTIYDIIKISESCLIRDKVQILTDELKAKFSVIMVYQLLRSKHSREFEHKIFEEKAPQILSEAKNKFMGKGNQKIDMLLENYQISEDMFKLTAMEATLDITKINMFAQALFNRCWVVYRIIGKNEFVTSDNPVMFMNNQSFDVTPFHNGIADNRTVIFYPISSKLMIVLYDYNSLLGLLNSYDCKLLFIDSTKDNRFINNVNRKQIEQCYRQVFCKKKSVLEIIQNSMK